MVRLNFKRFCILVAVLLPSFSVYALIYKWVDERGLINYSQQPPSTGSYEILNVPSPPPLASERDKDELQQLMDWQKVNQQAKLDAEQQARQIAEQQAIREQNCRISQQNLGLYQNNPAGRRIIDNSGNATRLTEEERQRKINEYQQQVELHCQ